MRDSVARGVGSLSPGCEIDRHGTRDEPSQSNRLCDFRNLRRTSGWTERGISDLANAAKYRAADRSLFVYPNDGARRVGRGSKDRSTMFSRKYLFNYLIRRGKRRKNGFHYSNSRCYSLRFPCSGKEKNERRRV